MSIAQLGKITPVSTIYGEDVRQRLEDCKNKKHEEAIFNEIPKQKRHARIPLNAQEDIPNNEADDRTVFMEVGAEEMLYANEMKDLPWIKSLNDEECAHLMYEVSDVRIKKLEEPKKDLVRGLKTPYFIMFMYIKNLVFVVYLYYSGFQFYRKLPLNKVSKELNPAWSTCSS